MKPCFPFFSFVFFVGTSFAAAGAFVPESHSGAAIQKAIDAAFAAGGGVVRLEKSVYPSGTLYLRSNVELNIPAGAVTCASKAWSSRTVPDGRFGSGIART